MSTSSHAWERPSADSSEQARATDLRTLIGVIRRSAWLIVLSTVVCAAGAFGLSKTQSKEYSATASVLLRAPSPLPTPFIDPSNTPERDAATNFAIASQEVVKGMTAKRLATSGDRPGADAVQSIELSLDGQSDVLKIKATGPTPTEAARVSNTFASQYILFRRRSDRTSILNAQALVGSQLKTQRRRLAAGGLSTIQGNQLRGQIKSLSNRFTDLGTLAALQTGNASVIEDAVPPNKPSSPKPKRDLLIGAFAGLMLGLALALGRGQLDRRLRRSEDVEDLMSLPVFGRIRRSDALRKPYRMPEDLPLMDAESFRMLRANLRYAQSIGHRVKSVLVTSAAMEDGKSTVAFYLAAVAAATGSRVLLVEADIRRPVLGAKLGLPDRHGLSSVLANPAKSFTEYCQQVPVAQHNHNPAESLTMDVLLGGRPPRNAAELIDSQRMADILAEAEQQYDLVVVDTPPVAIVSDAIPLMRQVDAVLVVARVGHITGDEMNRLREQLDKVGAPTVGVVANFVSMQDGGYYAYGSQNGAGRELVTG